jgi:alpha-beta hydrolase superfamily lysophospholipase
MAESLASRDYKVIGAERRGSGLNRIARGDAPSRDMLVRDLWRIVDQEHDRERPLFLVGWCWGAVLALAASVDASNRLEGLILLAPGLFPSRQITETLVAQRQAVEHEPVDRPCLACPIREEMFTRGVCLEQFILADDARIRFVTRRFDGIMQDMGKAAALQLFRVTQPMLVILAAKDQAVDNDRTLNTFARVTRAQVTTSRLDCHHGMQFEASAELVGEIVPWLEHHRGTAGGSVQALADGY